MVFPLGFAENSIQLVPDGTLLLHVLIILVMVYVLNATLFKPINLILEARVLLEVESRRNALEIGARVLSRPITNVEMN
jgi:hypothetical protein